MLLENEKDRWERKHAYLREKMKRRRNGAIPGIKEYSCVSVWENAHLRWKVLIKLPYTYQHCSVRHPQLSYHPYVRNL